jgi:hypothetical protein
VEGAVYAFPPLFHAPPGWHEVSIKLRTSSDAASYLPNRHRPDASIDPPDSPGDLSEIIEAQQPIPSGISSQAGTDPSEERPSAGAGEVRVYLLFQVHVTNHRSNPFSENAYMR